MGDGSFPHRTPERDDTPGRVAPEGGRVLDFPVEAGDATPQAERDAALAQTAVNLTSEEEASEEEASEEEVPAGVWAGGETDEDVRSSNRLLRPAGSQPTEEDGAEVVVFPRSPTSETRRALKDASGTQKTQEPIPPPEPDLPRYLASELLREDLTPAEPLKRTMKWGAVVGGAIGAIVMLAFGGFEAISIGLTAGFILVAVAGLIPLEPRVRGVLLAVLGASGAIFLGYHGAVEGDALGAPLLLGCTIVTASALFFRAAHRTSRFARAVAAVGLAATAGWWVLTGGPDSLVVETMAWQSWMYPSSRLLLLAIGLGALLTFLDPRGHGGAWIAGAAFVGWLALDSTVHLLVAMFPERGAPTLDVFSEPRFLLVVALPLFAAVTAVGLTQVWVIAASRPPPASSS